jgi:hypothetical protein
VPGKVEDWDVEDPAGKPLAVVREIRDDIERRVKELLDFRLEEIRSDDTAHRHRLARLLPPLIDEFEPERTPQQIRDCADAILADYVDVPVRSFTMTLATKRARECLSREICDVLVGSSPRSATAGKS